MRDIKFRAWDTLRKKMGSWEEILSSDRGLHFVLEGTSNNRWIPMQYTGLKDKNGKEIYEGDIVKFTIRGTYNSYDMDTLAIQTGQIVFRTPCVMKIERFNPPYSDEKYYAVNDRIEVIGNIHERGEKK